MGAPNQPADPQYFLTLFDEFKNVHPEKIKAYLQLAGQRVPPSVWAESTQYATALLAAHMLATSGPQGGGSAGGALTAEQVGNLSRSFQAVFEPGSGDAPLMTTRYGIDFVALRKETIVSMRAVRMFSPRRFPPYGGGGGCY